MKKYLFLLILPLVFLLPSDVFATEGFGAANVPWYANTTTNSALPLINGTRYRYQTFTPQSYGWFTTTFYAKINNTFTAGRFDYVIIDLWTQNGTGDDEIIYYNNTMQYATQGNTTYTQDVVSVYLVQQNTAGGTQYLAPCYPLGQSKSDSIVYNLYCPIYSAATIVHSVKVETYINHVPSTGYSWTWGLSDWYSYHYSGADSNTLQQAIQDQTTNITQAQEDTTNAVNDVTNSLNDSSTTDANTKGDSFFTGFGNHNNAHLTTIITAPLRLFSAMTTECSQPMVIPLGFHNLNDGTGANIQDKNISISCYANFWNRQDVSTFRTFWNLLIGGPAIYGLLVLLMKVINDSLDPTNDALVSITIPKVKGSKTSKEETKEGDGNV